VIASVVCLWLLRRSGPQAAAPWRAAGGCCVPSVTPVGGDDSRARAAHAEPLKVSLPLQGRPCGRPPAAVLGRQTKPQAWTGLELSHTRGSLAGLLRTLAHGFAGEVAVPARRGSSDRQPASPDRSAGGARSAGIASFHGHTRCTADLAHGA
jgi:hypothetical protein